MRLALAQLDFTVGDFDGNFDKIRASVAAAAAAGADLVIFSEMATTGYPPRDLLNHPRFIDGNLALLDRVAALSTSTLGILIGFVDRNTGDGKPLHNAVALCHDGRVAARRHKLLLPTYDVFDEDRYFEPGREVAPLEWKGVRLGVTICEDLWNDRDFWPKRLYHRDPVCELTDQRAMLLINISASPFTLGKADLRRRMIRQEAAKHRRYFFYLNQVGGNDELVFDGHSIGIDPSGADILRARDFAEDFLVVDVPLEPGAPGPGTQLRDVAASDDEAAYRALVLGLGDYARKCGFGSAVVGLSGGIDSALTACLAVDALGAGCVHGVAMPTRFSSAHSLTDAADLARNLGIHHQVIPIDAIFQSFLEALAPAFGGRPPGTAEENLQARARGAVLMALSNKFGHLLLSTGNKSELAIGYCTLYGDMCGGLAIINDVPKTLVYRLARFVNRDREIVPESTIRKPPSAELRPNQVDADSVPSYEILDPIVEAYVERDEDIDQICRLGFDRALVADVLRRIDASEYKRRQAAPGIKISSKAFGLGRRYPMAARYL
ncbi:MAG: NAD+ synthase [Betaproteobacteria bacterium]